MDQRMLTRSKGLQYIVQSYQNLVEISTDSMGNACLTEQALDFSRASLKSIFSAILSLTLNMVRWSWSGEYTPLLWLYVMCMLFNSLSMITSCLIISLIRISLTFIILQYTQFFLMSRQRTFTISFLPLNASRSVNSALLPVSTYLITSAWLLSISLALGRVCSVSESMQMVMWNRFLSFLFKALRSYSLKDLKRMSFWQAPSRDRDYLEMKGMEMKWVKVYFLLYIQGIIIRIST